MTKRLVVIDGKSVFYRGYYAMPNLATEDGTPTGGVYGFAALSLEIYKKLQPDYVAVAWDKRGTNIRKRKEIYPEYKAGRKAAPADFYEQIPMLMDLLKAFGWPLYELDDYEADDIMASLARQASSEGIETCLVTSDLDALQAVGPLTHVYAMKKGFTDIELFKPESFEAKYNIRVDQFLDLKSLKGDSSDNIPGVPGIGEKIGIQLLQEYGTLDSIYENLDKIKESTRKKLEAGKESAYISQKIAELWADAPIGLDLKETDARTPKVRELRQLLEKLQFRSLLRNLPDIMVDNDSEETQVTEKILPAKALDSSTAKTLLQMSDVLVVYPQDDQVWISARAGEAVCLTVEEAAPLLIAKSIIAHDAKTFLKTLLTVDDKDLPTITHDTDQAAFLLNPLQKNRSLSDLAGFDIESPEVAVNALWKIYTNQNAELDKLPRLASVARNIDFPLMLVLARMEHTGILLDASKLKTMNEHLDKELVDIRKTMYAMVDEEFNISSPSQLANILFDKLKLPTAGIKKGKTGYSTGQKELDKLRGKHPVIELIERYRELTKLQNTYVETLPLQTDKSGRIHTNFRQDVAATGRLSSVDPNLQNIPIRTDLGRKIREAFIPAPGHVFVSADYSQFELRLAAVLSGDKQMTEDFNSDIDIHTKTASDLLQIPLEKVSKNQRRDAKVVNFGVLYGMGPHALAQNTGMDFASAKKFIDDYFTLRSGIKTYIDSTVKHAREEGFVETFYGRRRPTPDVMSSNFIVRSAAERAAANMPIQGTEADLMKKAMLEVDKKIGDLGRQVLQIHDSILVECPEKNIDAVSEILVTVMESIAPELNIKLKVDVSVGSNWGEA